MYLLILKEFKGYVFKEKIALNSSGRKSMRKNPLIVKGLVIVVIVLFFCSNLVVAVATTTEEKQDFAGKRNISASRTSRVTIYVDDDNTEGPWDGTIEHPYRHIMDAIAHTNNEDAIFVFNGIYQENFDLVFHGELKFNLTGENKISTIIDGTIDLTFAAITMRMREFTITGNILLEYSGNNNIIEDNIFTSGGVHIKDSEANIIRNNMFYTNYILLQETKNNVIMNNTMSSGGIIIVRSDLRGEWDSHIIENNTVNGKPIRYYKNKYNETVPQNTGQLILVGCHNFTMKNLDISNVEIGIQLAYSSQNHIFNCNIHDASSNGSDSNPSEGINYFWSGYNALENSTIKKYRIGIANHEGNHNIIIKCSILECDCGIELAFGTNIEISKNNISYNYYGITCYTSKINITFNNIAYNNQGIYLEESALIKIMGNSIISNSIGVVIAQSLFVTVKRNNFIQNTEHARFYFAITQWSRNYWGRPRFAPYIIHGEAYKYAIINLIYIIYIGLGITIFPHLPPIPSPPSVEEISWVNFDWNPTLKPYTIPL
jgi:parallel beta-helix repeat protein